MSYSDFGFLGDIAEMFKNFGFFLNNWFDNLFTKSIKDVLAVIDSSFVNLPDWGIFDITLGAFILGAGLTYYVAYQLITWVLNVIT